MASLVASLALCTAYAREGESGPIHTVQGFVQMVVSPFSLAGSHVTSAVDEAGQSVSDATADDETLSSLKERNAELTELVSQTEEYRQENERLRLLLDMKTSSSIDGFAAHVIGRSTDAWSQSVTIDAGEDDGVDAGLTVMGPYGVVGQVIATTPSTSTVRLLSDPQSGAAAMIQSSRAEGIVRGSLNGLLYLENVDANVEVSVGDLVITSGLGGSYTSGLLIGTVVRVDGNLGDSTRRIVVSPNEQASVLEDVLVVRSCGASASSSGGES